MRCVRSGQVTELVIPVGRPIQFAVGATQHRVIHECAQQLVVAGPRHELERIASTTRPARRAVRCVANHRRPSLVRRTLLHVPARTTVVPMAMTVRPAPLGLWRRRWTRNAVRLVERRQRSVRRLQWRMRRRCVEVDPAVRADLCDRAVDTKPARNGSKATGRPAIAVTRPKEQRFPEHCACWMGRPWRARPARSIRRLGSAAIQGGWPSRVSIVAEARAVSRARAGGAGRSSVRVRQLPRQRQSRKTGPHPPRVVIAGSRAASIHTRCGGAGSLPAASPRRWRPEIAGAQELRRLARRAMYVAGRIHDQLLASGGAVSPRCRDHGLDSESAVRT